MATKVKGDAIKEGSIPLSALSNEVKGKIENAGGGADWNAKEGEAGYIENKPFYFNNNVDIHFLYEPESDTVMCDGALGDNDYAFFRICTNISGVEDNGDEPIYVFHKVKADNSYKFMDEDYGIEYNICVSDISIELFINTEFISKDTICKYVGLILPYNVRQLDASYLPETVIKTTPQTLSNTDKNQALANLGIDPVVLKYLVNPFILGEYILTIPLELRDIILGDYSEEFGYTLKPIASSLIKIYNGAGFTSIATFGNGQDYNIDFENNKFIINNDYEIEFV